MSKYAVVRIKGKQYMVSVGEEFLVDLAKNQKIEPEVLLVADGEKVEICKPLVSKAKIGLKIVKELEKGEKIDILKYKAKSRYRKHMGFTPKFTRLLVEKIS